MTTLLTPAPTVLAHDPYRPHCARIVSIEQESPGIATYGLRLEDAATRNRYCFRAGQFNMLYLPGIGEAAISISGDPHRPETLLHSVRAVGNVTKALARKKPGDQVLVRGPFGSCWPIDDCLGKDVIIAAGGVGLPPLRPLLYDIVSRRGQFGRVTLLYGARTPGDLLFKAEYDVWRNAGIDVEVTVDIGIENWQGHIGVVPSLFDRTTVDAANTYVFTCGPEIMMRFVIGEALNCRIDRRRVFLSLERNMNCAVGFCGHCQLGPAFVCKDGPVFNFERMEPFLRIEDF
jgi:NAD(P)H-flavin reductase